MPLDEPGDLPAGARRLLLGPVDSFEKLEVVLALREAAGASMTVAALATRACVPVEQIGPVVSELAEVGLLERLADGTWRVGASADMEGLDELAAAWVRCRAAVLKAMTGRAVRRIRASAAQAFADAFRLRRPKGEGQDDG